MATVAAPTGPALAWWLAAAALVVAPLVFLPGALDAFRAPQRVVAEWLAIASLVPLAAAAGRVEHPWGRLLRSPAILAVAPLLLVASLSLATTAHPLHVREALVDLWIGCAALVGWSLGFPPARLRRLLDLTIVPGVALALLGILQLHGLWRPLVLEPQLGERLAVTSLLGNAGDLGVLLVLPCLVAQAALARPGRWRWAWAVAGACSVYALVGTQTLTAIGALAAASLVLWTLLLPPRRGVALAGVVCAALVVAVVVTPPVRERVVRLAELARAGNLNDVLSGRLDAWRVAGRLLAEHPIAGVGHGAFRAEFPRAKIELVAAGVPFYEGHINPSFANAHNELLEVGADLGWPGLLALLAGCALAVRAVWSLRRVGRAEMALGWAGLVAIALVALTQFPFRLGSTAYPWLAFFAWLFATSTPPGEEAT